MGQLLNLFFLTCLRANVWILTHVTPPTLPSINIFTFHVSCACPGLWTLAKCSRTFQAEAHLVSLDAHSLKGWTLSCFLPNYITCVRWTCDAYWCRPRFPLWCYIWYINMQIWFMNTTLDCLFSHATPFSFVWWAFIPILSWNILYIGSP